MKALLLTAGYGERLRPLTNDIPKPLLPVLNVPCICYSIMLLKEVGITDIICNLHWKPGLIKSFFEKYHNFDLNISFSYEDKILGTGGGLKACEDFFNGDDFIIINSDIISDIHLQHVIDCHINSGLHGTIVVNKSCAEIPTVSVDQDKVVDFKNFLKTGISPQCDYMGIAILSAQIFPFLSQDFSSIVYTGYTELAKNNALGFYEHSGDWKDIGTIASYRQTSLSLTSAIALQSRLSIHTKLSPFVEPDDFIIPFNTLIKNSIIGTNCTIGEDVSIENSIILPGAIVDSGIEIFDKIVYKNMLL